MLAYDATATSGSSIPTSFEERVRSERAVWLGSNASRRAASQTRSRVSLLTFGLSLSARDAVARDTPAAAATSARVGRRTDCTAVSLLALDNRLQVCVLSGRLLQSIPSIEAERRGARMSDSGISRRDLVRRGGLAAAGGAAMFGLAGCA